MLCIFLLIALGYLKFMLSLLLYPRHFGLFDQPCWLYVPEAVVVAVGVGALACHENWGGICEKDSLATPQTPTCNTGNCVVRSATTGFRVSFGLHF